MKVTLESTTKIVELNGIPARMWEGETDDGIPVHAFITRIAPSVENPGPLVLEQFEADLAEQRPPSAAITAYPARLIL